MAQADRIYALGDIVDEKTVDVGTCETLMRKPITTLILAGRAKLAAELASYRNATSPRKMQASGGSFAANLPSALSGQAVAAERRLGSVSSRGNGWPEFIDVLSRVQGPAGSAFC